MYKEVINDTVFYFSKTSLFDTSSEGTVSSTSQSDYEMDSLSSTTTDSSNMNLHINNQINNIKKEVDKIFPPPAYAQTSQTVDNKANDSTKAEEKFFQDFQLDLCLEEEEDIY